MSGADAIEIENKYLCSLRHKKVNIGILMRIVKSQKYYKLSESMHEVQDIVGYVPELEKYYYNLKGVLSKSSAGLLLIVKDELLIISKI